MGDLLNHNMQQLYGAFTLVDQHLFVKRRILEDLRKGTVRVIPDGVDDLLVDYEWYYKQFKAVAAFISFIGNLAKYLHTGEAVEVPEQQDDFVFGGSDAD